MIQAIDGMSRLGGSITDRALYRPVATGGRGGAEPPLEKFEPPLAGLGCPPWHFIGIGIEVYSPPGILSAPPTNDTWLRRWLYSSSYWHSPQAIGPQLKSVYCSETAPTLGPYQNFCGNRKIMQRKDPQGVLMAMPYILVSTRIIGIASLEKVRERFGPCDHMIVNGKLAILSLSKTPAVPILHSKRKVASPWAPWALLLQAKRSTKDRVCMYVCM